MAPVIAHSDLCLHQTSIDNSVLYEHDLRSYVLFDTDGNRIAREMVVEVGKKFEVILQEAKKLRHVYKNDTSLFKAFSRVLEKREDLRLDGPAQQVLEWYICRMEGWFAADASKISLLSYDQEENVEGGHALVANGYNRVISTLAQGVDVRLNHRAARVLHSSNSVKVVTEDGRSFTADAAVITVPLGVLKAKLIKFEPNLPDWKEEAISGIGFGNENKIVLFYESMCWPDVDFLGIAAPTAYECSYFLSLHKATGHPVLVYMPAGSLADDIERLSDDAAMEFALTKLRIIVPHIGKPIRCMVSRWGSDPNSLGCYSYDGVGKSHALYMQMHMPVNNLFFAGEATSIKFPGTVHGAFATGLMAAEECWRRFEASHCDLEMFQPVMAEEPPNRQKKDPFIMSKM
ncbi:hypothetical protein KP509_19G019600 [Ceratopteris richardii]|nr:hypothetical protein KP509_19G019600 [Ceratopteris richardii]